MPGARSKLFPQGRSTEKVLLHHTQQAGTLEYFFTILECFLTRAPSSFVTPLVWWVLQQITSLPYPVTSHCWVSVLYRICYMKTWNSISKSFTQSKLITSPDKYFLLRKNVAYMSFWESIIAYANGGSWAPLSYVCPPWLKPLVTPLVVWQPISIALLWYLQGTGRVTESAKRTSTFRNIKGWWKMREVVWDYSRTYPRFLLDSSEKNGVWK